MNTSTELTPEAQAIAEFLTLAIAAKSPEAVSDEITAELGEIEAQLARLEARELGTIPPRDWRGEAERCLHRRAELLAMREAVDNATDGEPINFDSPNHADHAEALLGFALRPYTPGALTRLVESLKSANALDAANIANVEARARTWQQSYSGGTHQTTLNSFERLARAEITKRIQAETRITARNAALTEFETAFRDRCAAATEALGGVDRLAIGLRESKLSVEPRVIGTDPQADEIEKRIAELDNELAALGGLSTKVEPGNLQTALAAERGALVAQLKALRSNHAKGALASIYATGASFVRGDLAAFEQVARAIKAQPRAFHADALNVIGGTALAALVESGADEWVSVLT